MGIRRRRIGRYRLGERRTLKIPLLLNYYSIVISAISFSSFQLRIFVIYLPQVCFVGFYLVVCVCVHLSVPV